MTVSPSMRCSCGLVLCPPNELLDSLPSIREIGYEGIELHPPHLELLADPGAREALAAGLAESGLEIACVNVGVLRDSEFPQVTFERCDAAVAVGAPMVFVLAPNRAGTPWETAVERVRAVCDRMAPHGIDVSLHHHAGTVVATHADVERFLGDVDRPNLGLLLDTAHYALYEDDLAGGTRALAPRTTYAHLKDLTDEPATLMAGRPADTLEGVRDLVPTYTDLGAGVLDLAGAVAALEEGGFAGWATIEMEVPRHDTWIEQARVNFAALGDLRAQSATAGGAA